MQEVVKHGVAKSLQNMTTLEKIVVISLYFVFPDYRIFKHVANISAKCLTYRRMIIEKIMKLAKVKFKKKCKNSGIK